MYRSSGCTPNIGYPRNIGCPRNIPTFYLRYACSSTCNASGLRASAGIIGRIAGSKEVAGSLERHDIGCARGCWHAGHVDIVSSAGR